MTNLITKLSSPTGTTLSTRVSKAQPVWSLWLRFPQRNPRSRRDYQCMINPHPRKLSDRSVFTPSRAGDTKQESYYSSLSPSPTSPGRLSSWSSCCWLILLTLFPVTNPPQSSSTPSHSDMSHTKSTEPVNLTVSRRHPDSVAHSDLGQLSDRLHRGLELCPDALADTMEGKGREDEDGVVIQSIEKYAN